MYISMIRIPTKITLILRLSWFMKQNTYISWSNITTFAKASFLSGVRQTFTLHEHAQGSTMTAHKQWIQFVTSWGLIVTTPCWGWLGRLYNQPLWTWTARSHFLEQKIGSSCNNLWWNVQSDSLRSLQFKAPQESLRFKTSHPVTWHFQYKYPSVVRP